MTEEEYLRRLGDLEECHSKKKTFLAREFINSLSDVAIDDKITDGKYTIIVEKIYPMSYTRIPKPYFTGVWVTKAGHPNKRGEKMTFHYSDKIRILKKGNCK